MERARRTWILVKRRPIAFWLLPAQPHLGALRERIQRLAALEQAPPFEPHLSLHVNELEADEDLERILNAIAQHFAPLTLIAGATLSGAARFKSLYVPFADPRPAEIQTHLKRHLRDPQPYALDPHLSLLYCADLPLRRRSELAAQHDLCGQAISFDAICAVQPGRGESGFDQVETWDSGLRLRLGSAARIPVR